MSKVRMKADVQLDDSAIRDYEQVFHVLAFLREKYPNDESIRYGLECMSRVGQTAVVHYRMMEE